MQLSEEYLSDQEQLGAAMLKAAIAAAKRHGWELPSGAPRNPFVVTAMLAEAYSALPGTVGQIAYRTHGDSRAIRTGFARMAKAGLVAIHEGEGRLVYSKAGPHRIYEGDEYAGE